MKGVIHYPLTTNRYSFVGDNPLTRNDLAGNTWYKPWTWGNDESDQSQHDEGQPQPDAQPQVEDGNYNWGNPDTLAQHFKDHGEDNNCQTKEDYARWARDFGQNAEENGYEVKYDFEGNKFVYDQETNTFAIYNPNGTSKTIFKPDRGPDYWNYQISKYNLTDEPSDLTTPPDDFTPSSGVGEPGGGLPDDFFFPEL